jgi:glycosyltransferase involved in cell wall biosynthesis
MKDNPLVSILVNCYNSETYLKNCLNSLINQTYKNLEIVIWDNKSTDNTKKIVQSFNDRRIKYFLSNSHKNLVESRIDAWRKLNGSYVAILDSDDIAYEKRIDIQIKEMLNNRNLAVVGGGVQYIDENGHFLKKKFYLSNSKKIYEEIYSKFVMNNSTLLFDKIKVDKVGGYSNQYVYINDYDLVYRLSTKYEIHNYQSVLSQNRIHKDSLSYLDNKVMQKELYDFLKKISSSSPNLFIKIKNIISRLKCQYRILRSYTI